MGDGEKKYYICLRCGHRFWSKAKKPQCSVCRSKRVMLYEDFLKLPEEEKQKLLGGFKVQQVPGDEKGEGVKLGDSPGESGGLEGDSKVISGEVEVNPPKSPGETGGNGVKKGDSPKITQSPPVKKGDSPRVPRVKSGDKKGERVKGERVKRLSLPRPKLSWKVYAIGIGLAFAYYLYKVGWFDELFRHLKSLGALKDAKKGEKDKPVVRSSPVLGKIEQNLRRG
ncbi:hypothetical protein [Palaeococcus ferrophilus]|uniref:hypothetical protein n=1 Tax=Palaeococcus ferrophilus TaxID=83868 RepID=UPI001FE15334|nr:hypothetical protein [Palaeococcus ferrophilus]